MLRPVGARTLRAAVPHCAAPAAAPPAQPPLAGAAQVGAAGVAAGARSVRPRSLQQRLGIPRLLLTTRRRHLGGLGQALERRQHVPATSRSQKLWLHTRCRWRAGGSCRTAVRACRQAGRPNPKYAADLGGTGRRPPTLAAAAGRPAAALAWRPWHPGSRAPPQCAHPLWEVSRR